MIWAALVLGLCFVFLVGFWIGKLSGAVDSALVSRSSAQPAAYRRDTENIFWCYRHLLFREPREDEAQAWTMPRRGLEDMARIFMMGPEFNRMPPRRRREAQQALLQRLASKDRPAVHATTIPSQYDYALSQAR